MTFRQKLEQQAQRAILKKALFDWKVIATLSSATLLTFLDTLIGITPLTDYAWIWAVGGLSLAVLLFTLALRDPGRGADAVADMLRQEFKPEQLQSRDLRQKLDKAFDHYRKMMRLIEARSADSMVTDELIKVADQMDEWIQEIFDLAKRIDNYRQENPQYDRKIRQVQANIRNIEAKLAQEEHENVRQEMSRNLESLQRKANLLGEVDQMVNRALLVIDDKLTNMGTIYLQATLVDAQEIDNSRARRLRQDIADEVQDMDDLLAAIAEVYDDSRTQF